MFAFLGSLLAGIGAAAGGIATGAASMATSVLSGAAGAISGTGAALFGGGMTVGQKMAAIAEPAYYETAGAGILGGLPAAATSTIDYLGNLAPKVAGIYQIIEKPVSIEEILKTTAIPYVPEPTAPTIAKAPLPIFSQQPATMTIGAAAKPEAPNYMLYIGLAILALFLLRKK